MGFRIKGLFRKRPLFVLSLDGVPYTFLNKKFAKGQLPYMSNLFKQGGFKQMNSTLPPVSSVAWSTYMTGKNPASHNIFGFIDRDPTTLELFIPTGAQMKAEPIWERMSKEGKRVIVINVPVTSPPRPVNGILISGFLAPSIDKAVYPPSLIPKLKGWDYQIDIDAQRAREDRKFLIEDLNWSTQKRFETAVRLMDKEPWDFFHLHIMGTDRINHFLWRRWEDGDPYFSKAFEDYYESIDRFIGQTLIPFLESHKDSGLIILSDHGFCRLKKEVYINTWLREMGWLKLESQNAKSIEKMHKDTKAYSLIPGRIYLNLKGREGRGSIDPIIGYSNELNALRDALLLIRDARTGEAIIDRALMRDEIYKGPFIGQSPDMVLLPKNGFDLKGNTDQEEFLKDTDLEGMHTYDDAFLFIRDHEIKSERFSILDVTPTLLNMLMIKPCPDLDGISLI